MHDNIKQFKQCGVTKVAGVLSPELCELISNYVRLKANNNPKIRRGNDPLSGVHREYADPLFETLLEQLTPTVEAATGLELWPTLSFCYQYKHGNILAAHKDRSSCEIVASLCLGADPKFQAAHGVWPLHLKDVRPITVNYGDMLIFRGKDIQHWRDEFAGDWFISAILGYVDKNGAYAFQKFDQRKHLGAKHIGMTKWYAGVLKAKCRSILDKYQLFAHQSL